MVTEKQIDLVQQTWAMVVPIGSQAAAMFYNRLFELDPGLRFLFRGDMQEQGEKLLTMIDVAVRGLSNIEAVVPAVEALGRRHAGYGVTADHYNTVAAALLWTLDKALGDAFTDEASVAWTEVYSLLANTMQAAAEAEALMTALNDSRRMPGRVVPIREIEQMTVIDAVEQEYLLTQVGLAS